MSSDLRACRDRDKLREINYLHYACVPKFTDDNTVTKTASKHAGENREGFEPKTSSTVGTRRTDILTKTTIFSPSEIFSTDFIFFFFRPISIRRKRDRPNPSEAW